MGIFGAAARRQLTSLVLGSVKSIAASRFAPFYRQSNLPALNSAARHTMLHMPRLIAPVLLALVAAPGFVINL